MENESRFDTQHDGMIYDAKFDYYGKRLATCSADGTIKVFLHSDNQKAQLASMLNHQGAALSISWSHPIFGSLLASSGFEGKILIWQEASPNTWTVIYECTQHEAPVNCISWSPWELGLILLAACFDGHISLIHKREDWVAVKFFAHEVGVCSVSWGPVMSMTQATKRFVSGGADHKVKVWTEVENRFVPEELEMHSAAVRSVDWRPIINANREILVSCSEEGNVLIWLKAAGCGFWRGFEAVRVKVPIWKVSWNITGNVIAASCGDNVTRLIKETAEGTWEVFMQINEAGKVLENIKN